MERLYCRCQSLADFPERGRAYGPRYRAVNESSYVIIYRVDPARRRVAIVAILHSARDIRRHLGIVES